MPGPKRFANQNLPHSRKNLHTLEFLAAANVRGRKFSQKAMERPRTEALRQSITEGAFAEIAFDGRLGEPSLP